ncbi:MAG: NAD(P)H-dependent oxidoreductase [Armatimonadetes bacterium]|nr:NAD(P)H-dependent oxidoreductase [Armatimonadota bacterium]
MEDVKQPENPVRIVGLCGSLRAGGYTRMALEVALQGARQAGAEADSIHLSDYRLIFCDGRDSKEGFPPDVYRLREAVRTAQGILLGTPEYHGSLSGVLKNALDLMGFDEFEGKMIGLVGVSGGAMGGVEALNALRAIGRALHAWVLPEQVTVAQAWKVFDADGTIKDARLEDRLITLGRQVARFAYLHSSRRSMEFLKLWEQAPPNPGGRR